MGKLRRKAKSPASGSTHKGIALPREKAMGLDGTSRARGGRSLDVLDKAKRYQVVWNPTHG